MKFRKLLLTLVLIFSILVTFIRLSYYVVNYASFSNLSSNLNNSSVFKSENFSGADAIRILRSKNNSDRVITFRQADLIHSIRNPWLDNFDPRFIRFLNIQDAHELYLTLIREGYKYIYVPPYTWPTIYRTAFEDLLGDPIYTQPLIDNVGSYSGIIDKAQLFELNSNLKNFNGDINCRFENPKKFRYLEGSFTAKNRLISILSGIPLPETIGEVENFKVSSSRFKYWLGSSNYVQLDNGLDYYYPRASSGQLTNYRNYSVDLLVRGKGLVYVDAMGFPAERAFLNLLDSRQSITRVYEKYLDGSKVERMRFQFKVQKDVETVRFRLSSFNRESRIGVGSFHICGSQKFARDTLKYKSTSLNEGVELLLEKSSRSCSQKEISCSVNLSSEEISNLEFKPKPNVSIIFCNFIASLKIDKATRVLCKSHTRIPTDYLAISKLKCIGNCLSQRYNLTGIDPSGIARVIPIVFEGDEVSSSGLNYLPSGDWSNLRFTIFGKEIRNNKFRISEVKKNDQR